ncbi:polymeric immunoglobulin receptor-like [Rhineura floridana]|uniref:polymeric immunoglobulin receptor-like n=1 Tax=Rhineura floridana TaxID=261503 RepID=UPI002AC869CE|nr:polymeric immunoglobulin receptor-like [Rhineura floridana]
MFLKASMLVNTFILLSILIYVSGTLYGPRLLISHDGGSVTIKCYYKTTTANRHGRKYWCKESYTPRSCQTIISTNRFTHQDYEGRVSMHDSPQNGILQVVMTQLVKTDSSNYRCGIGNTNNGLYAGVNLTIWEGPNLPVSPEIFWGKLGGSVMIQCPSETAGINGTKFFCKMRRSGCSPILETSMNGIKQQEGRIIFTAGDSSETFKVFINELRREDKGMYKCGTGTLDNNASSRTIQLEITEESVFSNILSDAKAIYELPTISTSGDRYMTSTNVTSTNEMYNERFSKTELNPLPIVIPVLVVLLVLAAIVSTMILKIRKRKKDASSDIPARNPEGEIRLTGQKRSEEHPREEHIGSASEQESALYTDKEVPVAPDYCLLGHIPNPEDLRETD